MDLTGDRIETALLVSLTALYPFHAFLAIGGVRFNVSLADPLVGVVLLLFLSGKLTTPRREIPKLFAVAVLFVAAGSIGLLVRAVTAPEYFVFFDGLVEVLKLSGAVSWLLAVYVLVATDTERRLWIFAVITALVAGLSGLWGAYATLVMDTAPDFRPSGPFNNPNLLADYLLLSIFLCLSWMTHLLRSGKKRVTTGLLGISALFSVTGILMTASRAAIGALLVGLVVGVDWRLILDRVLRDVRVALGVAAVIVGGVSLVAFSELFIVTRFEALLRGARTGSRVEGWLQALEAVVAFPVFGIGLGQNPNYLVDVSISTPHNTFVSIVSTTGLVGSAIAVWFLAPLLRDGFELRFHSGNHCMRLFAGFLLASLAFGMFHKTLTFRSFWIAVGLIVASVDTGVLLDGQ